MTIEGDCKSFGVGTYNSKKAQTDRCPCITAINNFGNITSINNYAFYNCSNITNIIIPNGVTNIGESAFAGCLGLESITIPSSVISIGIRAFVACQNIANVSFGSTVGWFVTSSATATSGTPVDVTDDPSTNAELLRSKTNYYWKRA